MLWNHKNDKMKLEEYIDIMIPMIILLNKEEKERPKTYKSRQLWYIYRQYFYGFAEFIKWHTLINASKDAQDLFKTDSPGLSILDQHWKDQPNFDKGRRVYNLDHIYTGQMFRNAVAILVKEEKLTTENIAHIIKENYRMVWILKSEEKRIKRSDRGLTLNDAINHYQSKQISLVNQDWYLKH